MVELETRRWRRTGSWASSGTANRLPTPWPSKLGRVKLTKLLIQNQNILYRIRWKFSARKLALFWKFLLHFKKIQKYVYYVPVPGYLFSLITYRTKIGIFKNKFVLFWFKWLIPVNDATKKFESGAAPWNKPDYFTLVCLRFLFIFFQDDPQNCGQ